MLRTLLRRLGENPEKILGVAAVILFLFAAFVFVVGQQCDPKASYCAWLFTPQLLPQIFTERNEVVETARFVVIGMSIAFLGILCLLAAAKFGNDG